MLKKQSRKNNRRNALGDCGNYRTVISVSSAGTENANVRITKEGGPKRIF